MSPRHLLTLASIYTGHGVELVERGGRWHFQTAPDLAHILRRTREEPRRLSRAATETLAIIAYHEPVSRARDRGDPRSPDRKGILDVLMEANWIRTAGRREGPGRPLLYATTPEFLTHFGLGSRKDLPGIEDLKAAGCLMRSIVRRFSFNWKVMTRRPKVAAASQSQAESLIWAVSAFGIFLSSLSSCCCCSAATAFRQ
jgi:segregation and condensation protein B